MYNNVLIYQNIIVHLYQPNPKAMIKKVKEMIKIIEADGWVFKNQKGSHRQYTHPTKKGKVTINKKPNDDLSDFVVASIKKQAGL